MSQFLDYARPYRGEQRQLEVAEVLKKTLALVAKEAADLCSSSLSQVV